MTLYWAKDQAKEFIIQYQMINLKEELTQEEAVKFIFDKLETVQFDPLDVVGRNSEYLYNMLYKERYLLDSWDKQMSIIKTSDFPYFAKIRDEREQAMLSSFTFHNAREAVDYKDYVINLIKEKGPLFSREIDHESARWKHGKLTSVTLDYLFNIGEVVVYDKSNAQKQFELTNRLFNFDDIQMSEDEFIRWYLIRRIRNIGLIWNRSSSAWPGLYISKKNIRSEYIDKLVHENILTEIYVEGIKWPFYALTETLENAKEIVDRVTFMAPLDNMLWDREMLKTLFDFDYTWEVYVPLKKRIYGYYVLPILYGKNFIGRIEFDHYKKKKPLIIKNVWFEENINITKKLQGEIDKALKRFMKYLGADSIEGSIKESH
jgi:uncharacterized protein YcaQ